MYTSGLSEIVLVVKDVKTSAAFYQEVVGLQPRKEGSNGDWAWFWAGSPGQQQLVALTKGPLLFEEKSPLPEGKRWGQIHYAFHVPRPKLEIAIKNVKEKGVELYGPVNFKWMKAIAYYFYDPDGNLLEFWSPNPE